MTEKKKAPYEVRAFYRPFIDACRGGGIEGDSDLTLQLVLGGMELREMKKNHNLPLEQFFNSPIQEKYVGRVCELNKLIILENLCRKYGGYETEATLKTPEDIEKALEEFRI